jgi:hypothetical protein
VKVPNAWRSAPAERECNLILSARGGASPSQSGSLLSLDRIGMGQIDQLLHPDCSKRDPGFLCSFLFVTLFNSFFLCPPFYCSFVSTLPCFFQYVCWYVYFSLSLSFIIFVFLSILCYFLARFFLFLFPYVFICLPFLFILSFLSLFPCLFLFFCLSPSFFLYFYPSFCICFLPSLLLYLFLSFLLSP